MTSLQKCNANHVLLYSIFFSHSIFYYYKQKKEPKNKYPFRQGHEFFQDTYADCLKKKKVILMQIFHTCLLSKRAVFGQAVKKHKIAVGSAGKSYFKDKSSDVRADS